MKQEAWRPNKSVAKNAVLLVWTEKLLFKIDMLLDEGEN